MKTDLSLYDNSWYHIGAGNFKNILWYFCNILFVKCSLQPLSVIKVRLLRLFGAKIGKGVVIKPGSILNIHGIYQSVIILGLVKMYG